MINEISMNNNLTLSYNKFGDPKSVIELMEKQLQPLSSSMIRVRMILSPINPSDLIPITGAYSHRIQLPSVVGYEGVGKVVDAHGKYKALIDSRVLLIKSEGTWQHYVDCHPTKIIKVPGYINNEVACRSYINPLSAYSMLMRWKPYGKVILVTGGGSECSQILGQWALMMGAKKVISVYRSSEHIEVLKRLGFTPISESELLALSDAAKISDLIFDAVGGSIGSLILDKIQTNSTFVMYGLLSGHPLNINKEKQKVVNRFHLRDVMGALSDSDIAKQFEKIWLLLSNTNIHSIKYFNINEWQVALDYFLKSGRLLKPVFKLSEL